MRRLTMLCLAAGLFALPPPAVAMDLPRLPKIPEYKPRVPAQPPAPQPAARPGSNPAAKRDLLRTVRLVMLGSVACAGLLVLVRLRWHQPVRSGDPTVRRTPVARILPRRRQGRVLQLDPPARHAPETRR